MGDREQEVLDFIKGFMKENGYCPTMREIGNGLGFSSTSSAHNWFDKLVAKGIIELHDKRYSVKGMKYVEENVD